MRLTPFTKSDPKIELLAQLPLCSGLSRRQLADIAAAGDLVHIPRETELVHEGERGEAVYLLVEGMVQVRTGDRVLAYLEDGDVVGELSVLDRARRSATVTAVADTTALVIDRRHLGPLLARTPRLARRLDAVAAPRRAA